MTDHHDERWVCEEGHVVLINTTRVEGAQDTERLIDSLHHDYHRGCRSNPRRAA